jgi:hypothetical protein
MKDPFDKMVLDEVIIKDFGFLCQFSFHQSFSLPSTLNTAPLNYHQRAEGRHQRVPPERPLKIIHRGNNPPTTLSGQDKTDKGKKEME